MSRESSDPGVTHQVQLDAVCLTFEQQWREGGRPSIESVLETQPEAGRSLLLHQLLLLELEYVEQAGSTPNLDDYLARFPQEASVIRGAFAEHAAALKTDNPSAVANGLAQQPITERAGSRIGRYKLLEQIGEGGMGVVYMAEQQRPVRRKVALKIIKPGMDTQQVVARFEAERQALAMMDHPNIARVLDAGSTESGRPFFVMELVRGTSITEYCDKSKLGTNQRLELFVLVARAVQHAHTKGIIHRDLKPTNILVTLHDGVPVPKIIDFGVSKAMGQQLTERTLFTAFAQMVGTPLYMSPEQAEMSGLDVDTRSDIYSLGVLLYELLTGVTPFDRNRLHTAAFDELRRIIREEEPERPSTRVSTMGESSVVISQQRSTDPTRLKQALRGELDWIVMKTLEKDRNRRYETANALVAEVNRYLNGEPVAACPPSTTYLLRKFARRFKTQVAVAAGFMLFLLVSSIVAWLLYADAQKARNDAVAATAEAVAERRRAEEQKERAEANFLRAKEQEEKVASLAEERQRRLYDYNLFKATTALRQNEKIEAAELLEDCLPEQRGWEWHWLARRSGLAGHAIQTVDLDGPSIVHAVTSPTEPRLAVVDIDGNLRFHELTNGRTIWSKRTGILALRRPLVHISPAGDFLAVTSYPGRSPATLEVWDTAGNRIWEATREPGAFGWVSFSRDGRYLAFSTADSDLRDGKVQLHDPHNPEPIWTQPVQGLACMAFDQTAKRLFLTLANSLTFGSPTSLCCWSVEEPRRLWSKQRILFSLPCPTPDGLLLIGGNDHTLELLEPASGESIRKMRGSATAPVLNVSFSPDGKRLASIDLESNLVTWDWSKKKETGLIRSAGAPGQFGGFTHDGSVVTGSRTAAHIYSDSLGDFVLSGHHQAVIGIAFSPDGEQLFSTGTDATLRTWLTGIGNEVHIQAIDASPAAMAISPRGTHIATGSRTSLSVWNAETGELVHKWPDAGRVWSLEFSPDGTRLLAATTTEKRLRVFDVSTGHEVVSMETPEGNKGAVFSADGRRAISLSGRGGQIDAWDLETGTSRTLRPHDTGYGLALLRIPNPVERQSRATDSESHSQLLAAAIQDLIEIWNVDTGQLRWTLRGHDGGIDCLATNDVGSRLFAGDRSGAVKVWNLETGEQLLTIQAHQPSETRLWGERGVLAVSLSPNGTKLATAGADKLIKIWEITGPSRAIADQRRIVHEAAKIVDREFGRTSSCRVVLESLTANKSLNSETLKASLDIAHVRGELYDDRRRTLFNAIESNAGIDLNDPDSESTLPAYRWSSNADRLIRDTGVPRPLEELVIDLTPDDPEPQAHQLPFLRGLANARMGNWQEADDDFSCALRLVPETTDYWYAYATRQAVLLAYRGQWKRYHQLCETALANSHAMGSLMYRERTVRMCLFTDQFKGKLRQAGELADDLYKRGHSHPPQVAQIALTKGIADLRRKEFASAIEMLEEANRGFAAINKNSSPLVQLYLAIAHSQLGHQEEAQSAFRIAVDRIETELPRSDATEFPNWREWMMVQIVRRKAEALVKHERR